MRSPLEVFSPWAPSVPSSAASGCVRRFSLGGAAASFFGFFIVPIINGSNQAIWQSKVPPDLQGKVFAVRRLIAQITAPLAMAIGGPLAAFVFEPAMQPGAGLAAIFGWLVGVGPGAGIGLMLVGFGIGGAVAGLR